MKKNEEIIKEKASYCLNCKIKPCSTKGCPLENDIPNFIKEVKENRYKEAYKILSKTTVLPGVCGRICPHEKQCQGSCVRGIKSVPVSIGSIEANIYDNSVEEGFSLSDCYEKELLENKNKGKRKKVAVIGAGPAGLTCSAFLAKEGIDVTIYEKYDYLGGLLVHGIPDFRLPKDIVRSTVKNILDLGINVQYNMELGRNLDLKDLEENFDAIFLAIGANKSSNMGIEGENLKGVFGGNELLEYNKHPVYENKKVAIIGGGNVAMDCARTVKKLGAKEAIVIYRRDEEQMPAEKKEIEDAKKEGIKFLFKTNVVKILGKNDVEQLELIKTRLIKKENEQRAVPENIENTNYVENFDYVIMALGSKPEDFVSNLNLRLNKWGRIDVDEEYRTSNKKIFSGGDIIGEKSTVAWASRSGREAAKNIIKYLY